MHKKKVCMLGAFAVGKTSLVRRFVEGIFSDKYLTTVGVKIGKKSVEVDGRPMDLVLWDIQGEDAYAKLQTSYLRGASGYLLVADGTRASTLEKARELEARVREALGPVPFVLVLNKSDLADTWEIDDETVAELEASSWDVRRTSAATGDAVEEVFLSLARRMQES